MVHTKSFPREPNFDPWNSSVFQIVKAPRESPPPMRASLPARSGSNYDNRIPNYLPEVDDDINNNNEVQQFKQRRSYTTTCAQTDYDYLNRGDDIRREYGGYISSRLPSANKHNNTYYQRLTGRMSDEPQTARHAEDRIPQVQIQGSNKRYVDVGPPVFRAGRSGAPWRHVTQCLGNLGNHICFIDGGVKENDIRRFPPYGYTPPENSMTTPRIATTHGNRGNQAQNMNSRYNAKAKLGYRYWPEDRGYAGEKLTLWPGASSVPKQTIQGRMMKLGVGY